MAKFDITLLKKQLEPALSAPKVKAIALERAKTRFEDRKRKFLEKFEEHKVTQEIRGGPDSSNLSGTLGGRGNLFSYIGFWASGGDPINDLKELLEDSIRLKDTIRVIHSKTQTTFEFEAEIPKMSEIWEATPFPEDWAPGSWVKGVESYISGLSHYIYWRRFPESEQSRSTTGTQSTKAGPGLRSATFKRTDYLGKMIDQLKNNLKDEYKRDSGGRLMGGIF